jgi:Carboxypeptidase regulatory-like domain
MRRLLFVVASLSAVSCGGGATPTGPAPATPGSFTLSGAVSETAPTASTPIGGAAVALLEGPNVGSTTTDATGRFRLSALRPGTITVRIRATDHVDNLQVVEITGDKSLEIQLDPVFRMVTTTSIESISGGGNDCPGYWDTYPENPACAVDFALNVHHGGSLRAEAATADPEIAFSMELHVSVDGRIAGAGTPLDSSSVVDVRGHTQYVIRVRKFSSSGASPPPGVASFTFTVTRPS